VPESLREVFRYRGLLRDLVARPQGPLRALGARHPGLPVDRRHV